MSEVSLYDQEKTYKIHVSKEKTYAMCLSSIKHKLTFMHIRKMADKFAIHMTTENTKFLHVNMY